VNRKFRLNIVIGAFLALLGGLAAFAQPADSPAQPADSSLSAPPAAAIPAPSVPNGDQRTSGDRSYILGIGDVIDVAVLGGGDYNTRGRVGSDGAVLLPLLGAVPANGRSPGQLADEVRAALQKGGFFPNPLVRIDVITVSSRYVTVLGYVARPGLLPLDREYRLSEVIARVGGRGQGGADFAVLAREGSPSERFNFADLAVAAKDKDPMVIPGDKIYVPAIENEVFYLTGQVKSPGAYPVSPGMTIRQALARGGGVGDNGNEKGAKIIRKGVPVKNVKLDETVVEAGDVIAIGERLF